MKGYKPTLIEKKEEILNPFNNRMTIKPDSGPPRKPIRDDYEGMKSKRDSFLSRAKNYAKMSIPSLFSDNESGSDNGSAFNQHGWQSLNSQCVNHLSNKLVMTWFPPQRSFFKMAFTDEAKAALFTAGVEDIALLQIMSRAEEKARMQHEELQGRLAWTQAAKHLIVAGNALLYVPPMDSLVCYPMDRYVVKRSKTGKLLRLIIEEEKAVMEFPPAIQAVIKAKRSNIKQGDSVKMYTEAKYDGEMYVITQEVVDVVVGTVYRVKPENLPFIILVWDRMYGEDYGRGHVESNAGDMFTYNFLAKAQAKGCAIMSEVKFLVKRGSATSPEEHAKAETGEYLWGEEGDITVVQLEKYGDFQTVASVLEVYSKRLGQAFLMMSANRRDAERVTTYELRLDAQELETSLGGTYSQIAVSGQLPYARLLLAKSDFKLPSTDAVPLIITGIEALGKAGEIDKLMQFSEMMAIPNAWSAAAQDRVKWEQYMGFIASNLNMETPWVMTTEEYAKVQQQRQEAAQQQAMMEAASKAAPQMMKE